MTNIEKWKKAIFCWELIVIEEIIDWSILDESKMKVRDEVFWELTSFIYRIDESRKKDSFLKKAFNWETVAYWASDPDHFEMLDIQIWDKISILSFQNHKFSKWIVQEIVWDEINNKLELTIKVKEENWNTSYNSIDYVWKTEEIVKNKQIKNSLNEINLVIKNETTFLKKIWINDFNPSIY